MMRTMLMTLGRSDDLLLVISARSKIAQTGPVWLTFTTPGTGQSPSFAEAALPTGCVYAFQRQVFLSMFPWLFLRA